jgi:two-component sensor histidine kinase
MAPTQDNRDRAVDQQRALAAFGEVALGAEDLSAVLTEACRLVGQALSTDLAKVVELTPDGKAMLVRAGVGWKPGVVNEVLVSADDDTPEGLTLKDGAVISPDINREERFSYHEFLKDNGVQAFVNVLILSGKGRPPYGVLQVDSRSPREFHQSDIEFLRTYANLLGAAINRFRMVDELRAALRDKELLINELNHRVKNTLATVQSIASQTLRNAPSPEQAVSALENRLQALSHAHDVLTRENWESANLSEIVAQAVEPYRSRGEHRIHVRGSPARLPPRMALALAMALQELATNAVKHGALSNPTGEVKVHWELTTKAGEYDLHMRWEESGGPSVVADSPKRGFGTRLIERTVKEELGGDLLLAFTPNGFLCELRVPFQEGARRL